MLRRKLSRGKVLKCLASQPPCLVVMEACDGANHWGREIQQLGHEVRLIVPAYVKPFAKRRQKSGTQDAAAPRGGGSAPDDAICGGEDGAGAVALDAVPHPCPAGAATHADGQRVARTPRGVRSGCGAGVANVEQLWQTFAESADTLPELVVPTAGLLFDRIAELTARIGEIDKQMQSLVWEQDDLRRLMTIPGMGEVSAMAVHTFAPPMESFVRGRDFAAWIGLTPREVSTGGRQQLGRITKMGQRDLRRLFANSCRT